MAACLLLRSGILPLLPASMVFPPLGQSYIYSTLFFPKCQPQGGSVPAAVCHRYQLVTHVVWSRYTVGGYSIRYDF